MGLWRGRRVLLTGHTGFKGAWAARWLARRGAEVTGLALPPNTRPSLHEVLGTAHLADENMVDLCDPVSVRRAVEVARPEVVLHMAAQSLVRLSYHDPVGTFATNLMGTVHLLEALREIDELKAVLVVTSDKVYENDEEGRAFRESDRLGGHDPYSASKAATEVAVSSYARSYFMNRGVRVATARGGNVIGGGDFADDRMVPDVVRAARRNEALILRNPTATRPWQHILDCLSGYFAFAERLMAGDEAPAALNFGPRNGEPEIPTAELVERIQSAMGVESGWQPDAAPHPVEKERLSVDANEALRVLGWQARLDVEAAIDLTAAWYSAQAHGEDMAAVTDAQIDSFEGLSP